MIWSIGFSIIYGLADTTRLVDLVRDGLSDEDVFNFTLGPTYVSLTQWRTQIVATILLTSLLVIAVLRSRMHLVAELRADTARSALSRYVSPDVADALSEDVGTNFGVPASRYVAVLLSLSRLNHWLPRGQADPEVMQGTADFHHDITDTLLPQADPVFDDAATLDTTVDMLDPQSTIVEHLVGSLLCQWQFRARWFLRRHEDLHLGKGEGQEAQILQQPAPGW